MKRWFILGLLVGSLAGFVAGVSVALLRIERLHVMGQPMERLAAAASSSTATYQIYLYAPYSVAEGTLNDHASLLARLADESSEESERGTYLHDLAVNQARLAKLAAAQGDTGKATVLLDEAMSHLRDSGSSWTEEELRRFVDRLDESNLEKAPPREE
jgi:hypothetical protein